MASISDLMAGLRAALVSANAAVGGAVVKERLAFAQDKLQQMQELVTKLETENARLRQELVQAEKRISARAELDQYTEYEGALFKMKPSGGHHRAVYCPDCHCSTSPFPDFEPFTCMKCGWLATFRQNDLDRILDELDT